MTGELILLIEKSEYTKKFHHIQQLSKHDQNEYVDNLPDFFLEYCMKKL